MTNTVEIIPAAKYYGKGHAGTVVLVNGYPRHFTGAGALREARAYAAKNTF